jgi:hypothetical protein
MDKETDMSKETDMEMDKDMKMERDTDTDCVGFTARHHIL